jgi:hypothetical protein
MLKSFLQNLENEIHPLLGPTLWGLSKWGLKLPNRGIGTKVYIMVHIFATIFVLTQYIELVRIRSNLDLALRNLSVTMLSTVCVVKAGTFVFWQEDWKSIIEYVSKTERVQMLIKDEITRKILADYKTYSRRVTYFYWALVAATVGTVILSPLGAFWTSHEYRGRIREGILPYPEIMSSWLPFDRTKGSGYCVSVLLHILICFYGGGVVATYDSNAVVLMSFFAGQLKLLSINCSRIFDDNEVESDTEKIKRIGECHRCHLMLVK